MSKPDPESPNDDLPELGDDFFQRAKPADQILGDAFIAAVKRKPGRPPKEEPKASISLRLDSRIVRHLRDGGPGWQTRLNDALADLIDLGRL